MRSAAACVLVLAGCTPDLWVDRTDDDPAASVCSTAPDDCSLRGAVLLANAHPGLDTILVPPGHYRLTEAGAGEDDALTGDLDITADLNVIGENHTTTVVDAGALDRAFDVDPATAGVSAAIQKISILNGAVDVEPGGCVANRGSLSLAFVLVGGCVAVSSWGGGVYNERDLEVHYSQVGVNLAGVAGGGIANGFDAAQDASLLVDHTSISQNITNFAGGGLFNGAGASMHVRHSSVVLNGIDATANFHGQAQGGGIYNTGFAKLVNSTISGNVAMSFAHLGGARGGGFYQAGNEALFEFVTVADNHTQASNPIFAGATGIDLDFGSVSLTDTLVVDTCLTMGESVIESHGGNLESPGDSCYLVQPSDLASVANPFIGPLAANGGRTDTHALLGGSPAVDHGVAGGCPSTDQRDYLRDAGACDTGAFEQRGTPPPGT